MMCTQRTVLLCPFSACGCPFFPCHVGEAICLEDNSSKLLYIIGPCKIFNISINTKLYMKILTVMMSKLWFWIFP